MTAPPRGTGTSGPRLDDERTIEVEVEGRVRSGRPTRGEERHGPEPPDPPRYDKDEGKET